MGTSKVLRVILLLAFVLAVACDGSDGPRSDAGSTEAPAVDPTETPEEDAGADEEAIKEAFEAYQAALLAKAGEEAVGFVTTTTIDYYDEMRTMALQAGKAELENRRISDRLTVLMLRHVMTARQLTPMTGEDLFAFAVDQGLIGEATVAGMEPEEVTVSGDVGTLTVNSIEEDTLIPFLFRREEGGWKLDLVELVETFDAAFQAQADEAGDETEFLFQLLTSVSGTRPSPDIWEPLDG